MEVERVGVAGAGTMGVGIAQLACLAGYETLLHDPDSEALERGGKRLRADLAKGAARGRWSDAAAAAAAARVQPAPTLEDLGAAELVVEAAPEDLELKRDLFDRLEHACAEDAVLATNTSSLSVTAIAARARRPQRICGMHFFNPPALMRLVELVAGEETDETSLARTATVAERMGRTPVRAKDGIGFLANRGARPFSLEALRLLGEGVAGPEQIDRIVRLGGGYRMGPFELMDLIGIDVNLEVAKSFYEQSFGEPRWRPHPLQQRLVDAGRLGRKAGRGWYRYGEGAHRADDPPPPDPRPESVAREPAIEASVRWVAVPDLERARVVELAAPPADLAGTAGAEAALATAEAHFTGLGKQVERLDGDAPGLVLGRIVSQLVNEACFAVGEGVGSADDLDTALRLGFNHPRGPFAWARAIGPGRVLETLEALCVHAGAERYRPAPLLRRLAEADSANRPG